MGRFLTAADGAPDLVVTSTAERARATAELAKEAGGWRAAIRETPRPLRGDARARSRRRALARTLEGHRDAGGARAHLVGSRHAPDRRRPAAAAHRRARARHLRLRRLGRGGAGCGGALRARHSLAASWKSQPATTTPRCDNSASAGADRRLPLLGSSDASGNGFGSSRRSRAAARDQPRRSRALPQPGAVLAPLQRTSARGGARPRQSAARASELPHHLLQQPRRVLHGPRVGAAAAAQGRSDRAAAGRHVAGRTASDHPRAPAAAAAASRRLLDGRPPARLGQERHPRRRSPRARRRAAGRVAPPFRGRDLPRPHAARVRPRPSVPAHLQSQHQPGGGGARPRRRREVRAAQGTGELSALAAGGGRGERRRLPRLVDAGGGAVGRDHAGLDRGGGGGQPRPAVPGSRDRRLLPVPRHAQRRLRDRRGRGPRPPHRDGGGGGAPPLRAGHPARDRQRDAGAHPRHPDREPRARSAPGLHHQRADRVHRRIATCAGSNRPDLRYPPFFPAVAPALPGGPQRVRRGAPARPRALPPLRQLRAGGGASAPGRRRPRRAGDQADALPRGPQLAHRRVVDGGPAQRQAGLGAGGAQGPLRRGEQHRVGAGAGRRRRPRRLRRARAEDPRQDVPGGAPRARRLAPLRAPRHRQLQRRSPRACTATSASSPATPTSPRT